MQLRKMMVMLAAVGSVSLMMTACGGEEGSGADTCAADADCGDGSVCNAGYCLQTCESAADCPDTSKNCAPLTTGATQKVCQCQTNALCNDGGEGDLVCDTNKSKACVTKCTANTDCASGQTCNTGTGVCEGGGGGTTCTGTSQSTCAYGQYCSGTTCAAAPVAETTTCSNFASNRPSWSATSSTGPVIYEVSRISYQTNYQYCAQGQGADDAFIVRVRAYRTDADWPATRSGLSGFFYVTTTTNRIDVLANSLLVPGTGYNRNTSNAKDAEFQVYLCRPSNSQNIQVGFFFTNGNPVCQDIPRQ